MRELSELPQPNGRAGERPDLATIDVAFIGLENVVPSVVRLLKPGGRIVALIKPQFQAKRSEVLRGGVVRDPLLHATVIGRVVAWAAEHGLRHGGLTTSPYAARRETRSSLCSGGRNRTSEPLNPRSGVRSG
jgi:23S rRNA (cytidine1920-2'-O)/16S rRNA (cytidine1409-2'-O)-methyltransferase